MLGAGSAEQLYVAIEHSGLDFAEGSVAVAAHLEFLNWVVEQTMWVSFSSVL